MSKGGLNGKQAGKKRPRVQINYDDEEENEEELEYEYEDIAPTKKKHLITNAISKSGGKKRQKIAAGGGKSSR